MITIFTGAGASKALNYPTTSEFFATGSGKNLQNDQSYQKVREFLRKPTLDVEDVLRLLYPFAELKGTPTGELIFDNLHGNWLAGIPSFIQRTNATCFDHYGSDPDKEKVEKLYLPVFELCGWEKQPIALFTTNYDPVTDTLMALSDSKNVGSHDGFNKLGVWDSGGYSVLKPKGLSIYRLHGSMSWVENNGVIRNSRDYSPRAPGYTEHLIIYPGFKGNPEQDGHPSFRFAHTALRKDLGESAIALVIGFSFRDPHLNIIFRDALNSNKRLKLAIWDPKWPKGPEVGLEALVQEFEGRIRHLPFAFGNPDALGSVKELFIEEGVI